MGNEVANITIIAVAHGRIPPEIPSNFVKYAAALQMASDMAKAIAVSRTGSLSLGLGLASSRLSAKQYVGLGNFLSKTHENHCKAPYVCGSQYKLDKLMRKY